MRSLVVKRAIDIVGAGLALVLLSPVMLAVALAVRLSLGPGTLLRQVRPGLGGRLFALWKFRTMTNERDGAGNLLADSRRLTRWGRFLRSTSLDELPEFLNVLLGQMSLVGPRPLLVEYLDLYTPAQARRHEVKPGITGWTQVRGRNALSWEEKLDLDVWYVDHWTLGLDLRILGLTLFNVLTREGIGAAGYETTMPKFKGSPERQPSAGKGDGSGP